MTPRVGTISDASEIVHRVSFIEGTLFFYYLKLLNLV